MSQMKWLKACDILQTWTFWASFIFMHFHRFWSNIEFANMFLLCVEIYGRKFKLWIYIKKWGTVSKSANCQIFDMWKFPPLQYIDSLEME